MVSFLDRYGNRILQSSVGKVIISKLTNTILGERIVLSPNDNIRDYDEIDNPRLIRPYEYYNCDNKE